MSPTFDGPASEPTAEQVQEYEVSSDLRPVADLSPEEVQGEIFKSRADKAHPLNDPLHQYHNLAVHRLTRLYERKFPEKTPEQKEAETQKELQGIKAQNAELEERRAEERSVEEFQRAETHLKALWGSSAYEANLALAKRVVQSFSSEADVMLLDDSGLSNDPEFVDLLYRVGQRIQEAEKKAKKCSL